MFKVPSWTKSKVVISSTFAIPKMCFLSLNSSMEV